MRADIVPGAVFPDYELPDHTSTPRKLSELQGEDPLIPGRVSRDPPRLDLSKPGLREKWDAGDLAPSTGGARNEGRSRPRFDGSWSRCGPTHQ